MLKEGKAHHIQPIHAVSVSYIFKLNIFVDYRPSERAVVIHQKTLPKSSLDNHQRVQNDLATIQIVLHTTLKDGDHGWWPVRWEAAAAKTVAVLLPVN